jgi:hypothetical protein
MVGGACDTHGGEGGVRNAFRVLVGEPEGR